MPSCRPLIVFALLSCTTLMLGAENPALDFSGSRFGPPPEQAAGRASGEGLTLMFVGDTKLGGRTAQQIARNGADYPFALVADELRSADIAFANYESAITDYGLSTPGKPQSLIAAGRAFVFKSDPATSGPILAKAGIDIVQLANNHAMDYCGQGLLDTCAALDASGISYVGAGPDYAAASSPLVIDSGGQRVGYLAYSLIVPAHSRAGADSPGINYLPLDYRRVFARDISRMRERCDTVVVGFHWGIESTTVPNRQQRDIGHAAIDAGADFVIGTHTHSMQGIEFYGKGVIAYSLGNFVFTGASSRLAGCILRVDVGPGRGGSATRPARSQTQPYVISILPCWINDGRPTPSDDKRLRKELERIMRATGSVLDDSEESWLNVEAQQ